MSYYKSAYYKSGCGVTGWQNCQICQFVNLWATCQTIGTTKSCFGDLEVWLFLCYFSKMIKTSSSNQFLTFFRALMYKYSTFKRQIWKLFGQTFWHYRIISSSAIHARNCSKSVCFELNKPLSDLVLKLEMTDYAEEMFSQKWMLDARKFQIENILNFGPG